MLPPVSNQVSHTPATAPAPRMTACLVCGHTAFRARIAATDRLYGTTQREFQIVECESCGLMRLQPVPAPEDLPRFYPAHYWYAPDASLAASKRPIGG